jgi:hypoxanthine phosphoribosyltransferase
MRKLITYDDIFGETASLSEKLISRFKGNFSDVVFVGVLKGAFRFHSLLVDRINKIPGFEVDFIRVSSYQGTESSGTLDIQDAGWNPGHFKGKRVVVVEDIVDTGFSLLNTIDYIKLFHPESIVTISMLNKPSRRKVDVFPDYRLFEIPDRFVVGFGLDHNEKYRGLNGIYILEDHER